MTGWLARLVESPHVADAALLQPADSPTSVLVVPQGFQSGVMLRQLVLEVAPPGWPLQVVIVLAMPRIDGELDAATATEMVRTSQYIYRYEPPETDGEKRLVAMLEELITDVQVSMTDTLADLGGDSLTAIQLAELLYDRQGITVDPSELYAAGSLRELARTVLDDGTQPEQR
jgi:acyl carrier protein